jgi:hypothetical protein
MDNEQRKDVTEDMLFALRMMLGLYYSEKVNKATFSSCFNDDKEYSHKQVYELSAVLHNIIIKNKEPFFEFLDKVKVAEEKETIAKVVSGFKGGNNG